MAYSTLEELKEYLTIPAEDTTKDALLTRLNEAAGEHIDTYCGRVFVQQKSLEDVWELDRQDIVVLEEFPVDSITSIQLNGEEIPSDEYVLDKDSGIIKFKQHLTGELVVKYNTTSFVPSLVKHVNTQLASYYYGIRMREGISSEKIGTYSYVTTREPVMEILRQLDTVRRLDV